MTVKDFFSKYKLHTILAIIVTFFIAGGISLGVLLTREISPTVKAAQVEGEVYITADGIQVESSGTYDYILTLTYEDTDTENVCELKSVGLGANSTATTIVIPETVVINGITRTITTMYNGSSNRGDHVFYGVFRYLTSATLPNTITNIGNLAFDDCINLTSINIPDSVTVIGAWAFGNCTNLATVTIGNSVTSIGEQAFYKCSSLISVTIPPSVKVIKSGAFQMCDNLSEINLSEGLVEIGDAAFADLHSYVENLIIPDSVETIGRSAFSSSFTNVTLGSGTKFIDDFAFSDASITGVLTINCNFSSEFVLAFAGQGMKEVVFGEGVTTCVFFDESNIEKVTFPNSLPAENVSGDFFRNCTSLKEIVIKDDNPYFQKDEYGALYTKDGSKLILLPAGLVVSSYTVKDTTQIVGESSLCVCENLETLIIPESVKQIGQYATMFSQNLKNVYFYNDISSSSDMIGYGAFLNNSSDVVYRFKDETSLNNAKSIQQQTNNTFTTTETMDNFKLMPRTITVVCDAEKGTVSGSGSYEVGSTTIITATANAGYSFVGWSLDGGKTLLQDSLGQANYTITVTQDATYTAVFESGITITSANPDTEFTILRETNNGIRHRYTIQTNSGYYIDRIALINNSTTPTEEEYQDILSTDGYLNTGSYCMGLHYITNTTGTELVLEVYYSTTPFTIYLDFTTEPQNYTAGGSVDGVAVSVAYQSADGSINTDETTISAIGEARIKGYTTIDGVEYVTIEAVAYTGYTFVGWQVDGEFISYTDDTNGTITLTGSAYRTANIPLSLIDGKQVFAVFE